MTRYLYQFSLTFFVVGALLPMGAGAQELEGSRTAVADRHRSQNDMRVDDHRAQQGGCSDLITSGNASSSPLASGVLCREGYVSDNGLVTIASKYSVSKTIDRLASILDEKGFTIFSRIDHAKNASLVDMELRPTELLIFGNPKVGSLLMQDGQTAGLDLPVKMLAWEDADSRVWLTYTDASWLAERHGLGEKSGPGVQKMGAVLAEVSRAAAGG